MVYILFTAYFILLNWLLLKNRFIKNGGLAPSVIVFIFSIKVMAGLFTGWMLRNNPDADTWNYHTDALEEYRLLFSHPKEYFLNLFTSGYQHGYSGIWATSNSYWNDLKTNLIVKMISVLDIFSNGNYYINVLLFNFFIFFGHFALFRVFNEVYKNKRPLLIITCFLLPSVILFSNTLHKEGIILSAVGIIVFCTHALLKGNKIGISKICAVIFSVVLIALFRSYVLLAMLPVLAAWMIAEKKKLKAWYVYFAVYSFTGLIFFLTPTLPKVIADRQSDFFNLQRANSYISTDTLQPTFTGFLRNAPQALAHGFTRPFLSDYHLSFPLIIFTAELYFYLLLIILFIFFREEKIPHKSFMLFALLFGFSMLFIIGYIVPVMWAIVRYRSIYLPLLISPLICTINWQKIELIVKIKN